MTNPNLALLTKVARALGELRERFVFVGGCATVLLLTDPAAGTVRPTRDVDVVAQVGSLAEYYALGRALEARGFHQGSGRAEPPYRWSRGSTWLDVLPVESEILGFSNRWYGLVMETARAFALEEGLVIRVVSAPCFVGCKLVAFLDRGRRDYAQSHDFEDVICVVDGREELLAELRQADPELRKFIGDTLRPFLDDPRFLNVLPGLLDAGTPGRERVARERLEALAATGERR